MEQHNPLLFASISSERGRHGRLIRLLADTKNIENGTPYGIGIDEETALLITDVGTERETGQVSKLYWDCILLAI